MPLSAASSITPEQIASTQKRLPESYGILDLSQWRVKNSGDHSRGSQPENESRPNTSFQRTRVRGGRGLGPLNSKR